MKMKLKEEEKNKKKEKNIHDSIYFLKWYVYVPEKEKRV